MKEALGRVVALGDQVVPFSTGHSWQVMRGKDGPRGTGRVLHTALEILQESFDPILDVPTQQDLLPAMVQAGQVGEWDFQGMHTIILRYK